MKSIILISGAVIFLMILFFAMGYLKKLRKAFDHADVKNFSGTDAERIVNAYRTEEGYLKRRTRVWLLTIALEAAVVLTTFGSVYYLANKDRWAAERELAQAQKEQKRLEAEKRKEQERLEAEKRKEQERLEAEKRKEQERLEAEKRKEQERLEAEKRKDQENPSVKPKPQSVNWEPEKYLNFQCNWKEDSLKTAKPTDESKVVKPKPVSTQRSKVDSLLEKQAEAAGLTVNEFIYRQKRLDAARKEADKALADYRKAERELAEAKRQFKTDKERQENISLQIEALSDSLSFFAEAKEKVEEKKNVYLDSWRSKNTGSDADIQAFRRQMSQFGKEEALLTKKAEQAENQRKSLEWQKNNIRDTYNIGNKETCAERLFRIWKDTEENFVTLENQSAEYWKKTTPYPVTTLQFSEDVADDGSDNAKEGYSEISGDSPVIILAVMFGIAFLVMILFAVLMDKY